MAVDEDEEEWRFSLDDLEEREQGEADEEGGGLFGADDPEPEPEPLEPGSPSLENAAFVALGAIVTILVLVGFAVLLGIA